MSATSWRRGPFSQKCVLARELLEARVNLRKVGRKDIGRIAGDPLREIKRVICMCPLLEERTACYPKWHIAVRGSLTYLATLRETAECWVMAHCVGGQG